MSDRLRVRDPKTGHEYTVTRGQLAVTGLSEDDVIDKPALGPNGLAAPALPRLPLGTPRAGSKAERTRAKKRTTELSPAAKVPGENDGQSVDTQKES